MIAPIPTQYAETMFRSRLEARIAACMDSLGVAWLYEPEAFEMTDGMRYLPDFYLGGSRTWLEVKPSWMHDEKAGTFAEQAPDPIFLATSGYWNWKGGGERLTVGLIKGRGSMASAVWVACPECGVVQPAVIGAAGLRCCGYTFMGSDDFWDAHYGQDRSSLSSLPAPRIPQYQDGSMLQDWDVHVPRARGRGRA